MQLCSVGLTIVKIYEKQQIYVKNAVYKHVNGKIAQLKQQISELGFLVVLHIDIDKSQL